MYVELTDVDNDEAIVVEKQMQLKKKNGMRMPRIDEIRIVGVVGNFVEKRMT